MPIVSFTSSRGFCDEKTKKVHKNNRSEWTTDKDTIQKEETRPKGRTAFCAKHSFISPFFVSLQFRCMLCFFFFFIILFGAFYFFSPVNLFSLSGDGGRGVPKNAGLFGGIAAFRASWYMIFIFLCIFYIIFWYFLVF